MNWWVMRKEKKIMSKFDASITIKFVAQSTKYRKLNLNHMPQQWLYSLFRHYLYLTHWCGLSALLIFHERIIMFRCHKSHESSKCGQWLVFRGNSKKLLLRILIKKLNLLLKWMSSQYILSAIPGRIKMQYTNGVRRCEQKKNRRELV